MKYSYSMTHLKRILKELGVSDSTRSKLNAVVLHFEEFNIHPVDCILTHDFYPIIEQLSGCSKKDTETTFNNLIKRIYEEDKKIFIKLFDYNKRPTLKKFIQLILEECLVQ